MQLKIVDYYALEIEDCELKIKTSIYKSLAN